MGFQACMRCCCGMGAILAFAEASHASVKHYDSSHAKGLPKTPVTLDLLVGLMAELQA